MIMLEHYDTKRYVNDIGIVKPISPFEMTDYVRPVCLPPRADFTVPAQSKCIISGFGIDRTGKRSSQLLHALLPIRTGKFCNDKFQQFQKGTALSVSDRQICAGGVRSDFDTCQGDSGGPLICLHESIGYVAVGIISWGFGCGKLPGVYTEIADYLDWIDANK